MRHIKPNDSSRKGDLAEYYAVTWLWDNGYEVFKNSGCTGPIDMIAVDNKGVATYIDVKTFRKRNRKSEGKYNGSLSEGTNLEPSRARTKLQKKLGVKLLCFNPKTRKLKFVEHLDDK